MYTYREFRAPQNGVDVMGFLRMSEGKSGYLIEELGGICMVYEQALTLPGELTQANRLFKWMMHNQEEWPATSSPVVVGLDTLAELACRRWVKIINESSTPPRAITMSFALDTHSGWEPPAQLPRQSVATPYEFSVMQNIVEAVRRHINPNKEAPG